MRPTNRFLPAVLLLCAPSIAWAGGLAVVAPLVDSGVGTKTTSNLTSLISSELDFSGSFDTVTEIAAPSSLNASCLSSTSCLGGIAKANGADTVIAGQVAPGSAGLKVSLVLYDAKKNTIVRKKQYELAADVGALATTAPKMVKEITGQGAAAAAAAEAESVQTTAFDDEEDFDFDGQKTEVKGKTKFTPDAKKGKLEDVDDEDDARAAAEAKAKAKAAADARAKAEATAKAKAEAESKARADAEAKARADAAAKAKAEAAARAKAEAEAQARADEEAEAEARAEAAAAAAAKASKSKKPAPTTEEEDLEAELANFSFGGGGAVKAEEEEAEEEEEVDTRSFSERHASTATKTPTKTTSSKAKVVEEDEEEEDVVVEDEEEEEAPPPRTSTKRVVEEEEEEEEPAPRVSTKRVVEEEDEEEEPAPRVSTARLMDDEEDEEEATRSSSRTRASSDDDEDLDGPSSRTGVRSNEAKAKFAFVARGGYSRFGNLDFVTYGVEMNIPVASRVVILMGIEGASTNRNYTEEERTQIATWADIPPEQVQDWNATLPINLGFAYKVPLTNVQPYVGLDGLAMAYTANTDFAFGGRVRGGCDFLVSDNFGFNLDLALGVLSGEQFDLIQKDLEDTGFYPEIRAGTVLTF